MGISVAEALQAVELENGRTYRCQVKDYWIELRVLGPVAELPAPGICDDDILCDAWRELPLPGPGLLSTSRLGPLDLPDLPDIPRDGEEA
jgi:hypothetical protein